MKIALQVAVVLAFSVASEIKAAEAIPSSTLSRMGLATIKPMSAEQGLAVRGKGTYAGVWGSSTANWGGQASSNNYSASASWFGKPSGATGGSFSFAGKSQFFGRFGR